MKKNIIIPLLSLVFLFILVGPALANTQLEVQNVYFDNGDEAPADSIILHSFGSSQFIVSYVLMREHLIGPYVDSTVYFTSGLITGNYTTLSNIFTTGYYDVLIIGDYVTANSSAIETFDNLFGSFLSPYVSMLQFVFANYWPYIIAFIVLSGIVALFISFARRITGGRK